MSAQNRSSNPLMAPDERPVTTEAVVSFLARRWRMIALVFLGTVVGTYSVLSLMTEKYEIESKILVTLGGENVDPPPTVRGSVLVTGLRLQDTVNEIQILRSDALVGRTVDEIGLEAFRSKPRTPESVLGWVKYYVKSTARAVKSGYNEVLISLDLRKRLSEREQAIQLVRDETTIEPEKDSDVIGIRTQLPDYALGERVQSKLIEVYMSRRGGIRQDDSVRDFLVTETAQAKLSLSEVEARIQGLKSRKSISSLEEQQSLLLRQIRDMTAAVIQAGTEIADLEKRSEELKQRVADTPREIQSSQQEIPNPLVTTLRVRLSEQRAQLATTMTKYQPDSEVVANLRKEIQDLESQIKSESATRRGAVTYEVNPLRQGLERSLQETNIALAGWRSKLAQQNKALEQLQKELRDVDESQGALQDAERNRKAEEERYLSLLKRRQAAQIDNELLDKRISNVRVLQAPSSSPAPVYPRKLLIFYASLGVGLLLGFVFALLAEYLDDRVRDAGRAEQLLGAPCLGVIDCGTSGTA